jgi:hypothetical protein
MIVCYPFVCMLFFVWHFNIWLLTNDIRPLLAMITDTCVFWHYINESSRSVCDYTLMKTAWLSKCWYYIFASELQECAAFFYFRGPALQQAYKPSVQPLSPLRTVWALMEGLCVPGVTRTVVAIPYLSRRCDVRMYRSSAGVTHGLPMRGRSAVRPVSL